MSYLICEKCGKQYPLPEGKESFNYEKCSCGGKLVYVPSLNTTFSNRPISDLQSQNVPSPKNKFENEQPSQPSPLQSRIKWKGIFLGLIFLFMSLILSVMILFGDDIPTNPSDIPMQILTYFAILTFILTIASGSVSSYLSGSKDYLEGALNGGMVGIILGFIVGTVGGVMVFIAGTLLFGLLSMVGGIIGIIPRKRSGK